MAEKDVSLPGIDPDLPAGSDELIAWAEAEAEADAVMGKVRITDEPFADTVPIIRQLAEAPTVSFDAETIPQAPAVLVTGPDDWASEGLFQGDCRQRLAELDADSIDAVCSDPPYGIGYMNKPWDQFAPAQVRSAAQMKQRKDPQLIENRNVRGRQRSPAQTPSGIEYDRTLAGQRGFQEWCEGWGRELYRVLKPGAYGLINGAPRSYHRMASGLEDAGFEIRDCFSWLFGQGFPKSKDLGGGVGTALKPMWEPIVLIRKPLGNLTTEQAYAQYGTGGLSIDRCRLGEEPDDPRDKGKGRWPGNAALDEEAAAMLDQEVGERPSGANPTRRRAPKFRNTYEEPFAGQPECTPARGATTGGPSRFFYCPKVSPFERDFGLDGFVNRTAAGQMTGGRAEGSAGLKSPRAGAGRGSGSRNFHPTVKPVALMRWLVKLICPPGGTLADPFVGSGTTAIAAALEGRGFFGTDLEPEYLQIAHARSVAWQRRARGEAAPIDVRPTPGEVDVPLTFEDPADDRPTTD